MQIKQVKPTKHIASLCFQANGKELKRCVVNHLTENVKKINTCRDTGNLFLTYIKAYMTARKDNISTILCKEL